MIAYLQPIDAKPSAALQRAVSGFRQREHAMPHWVVVGADVEVDDDDIANLGLRRVAGQTRPGHVLVGVDHLEDESEPLTR